MLRFRLGLVAFALFALGCEEPQLYVPYGDGGVSDGSSLDGGYGDGAALNASITLAGFNPIVVPANTDVTVQVVILVDGAPLEGATVSFAIDGVAQDTSLDRTSTTTSSSGLAEVVVRGGSIPTSFQLRVTLDGASPQYIAVNVAGAVGLAPGP